MRWKRALCSMNRVAFAGRSHLALEERLLARNVRIIASCAGGGYIAPPVEEPRGPQQLRAYHHVRTNDMLDAQSEA